MNKKHMKKATIIALTMILTGMTVTGCKSGAPLANTVGDTSEIEKNVSYLKAYFDIEMSGETVEVEQFNLALTKLAGEEVELVEGKMDALEVLKVAMNAANFKELVESYTEEKVTLNLKEHGIKETIDQEYRAYLACALDTGFLTKEEGAVVAKNEAVTMQEAEAVLMKIASINGEGRNYLGYSSDATIYSKLDNTWNSFLLFEDATLSDIGKTAVQNKIVTGYNIKNEAYNANFLPELTLQYGHSDIKHAHQLLGLLNSEGIVAKVQLEPKVSVYEYLLEWGPIPETTPTYEVKQYSEDLYVTHAVEYDLKLEFETKEQMERFDEVIEAYAKKNEGNEEAKGLIYASWWQPLYSTTVTDLSKEAYCEIGNYMIDNGMYSLQTFYLPKDQEVVVTQLDQLAATLQSTTETRYCNKAFYHYLTGDDYQ